MTSERYRQRHADVLEFLGSGAGIGGELQAALESFLVQSPRSARSDDSLPTFRVTSSKGETDK